MNTSMESQLQDGNIALLKSIDGMISLNVSNFLVHHTQFSSVPHLGVLVRLC